MMSSNFRSPPRESRHGAGVTPGTPLSGKSSPPAAASATASALDSSVGSGLRRRGSPPPWPDTLLADEIDLVARELRRSRTFCPPTDRQRELVPAQTTVARFSGGARSRPRTRRGFRSPSRLALSAGSDSARGSSVPARRLRAALAAGPATFDASRRRRLLRARGLERRRRGGGTAEARLRLNGDPRSSENSPPSSTPSRSCRMILYTSAGDSDWAMN